MEDLAQAAAILYPAVALVCWARVNEIEAARTGLVAAGISIIAVVYLSVS